MGLTLERWLGTSDGVTCVFFLISGPPEKFLETRSTLCYVSVKCQPLWCLGAWLRSPSATSEILILIKKWCNLCSFGHTLYTSLAAPGCNVSVHLSLKGTVHAPWLLPRLTEPNPSTEIKEVIQASSLLFDLIAPGPLHPWDLGLPQSSAHSTSYWELWIWARKIYDHDLNPYGFEWSLWLSCICQHTCTQYCNPQRSAPCRTEPLANPSKPKSIDFQSKPRGFLICIFWASCLLRLSLLH